MNGRSLINGSILIGILNHATLVLLVSSSVMIINNDSSHQLLSFISKGDR